MSESTVDRLVLRCEELSALPMVTFRLLGACALEETGPEELASILEGDPALCADALRLANGAGSAPVEPVVSIREACQRLGRERIGLLAANVAAFATYRPVGDAKSADVDFLWRHALLSAVASSWFAERAGLPSGPAHVAGLLQNLSFLALAQGGRDLALQAGLAVSRGGVGTEVERGLFEGRTHGGLSAALLARWDLPSDLLRAVTQHTDAEGDADLEPLLACTRRGDSLACTIMAGVAKGPLQIWWSSQTLPLLADEIAAIDGAQHEVSFRALELLTLLG